ncbi:hypothetical protein BDQ17DRAFT_1371650 [Cyathus striatus]|nr:hypothetical protein BDQ17DRAFT_1371650 [Cyathus striatus]
MCMFYILYCMLSRLSDRLLVLPGIRFRYTSLVPCLLSTLNSRPKVRTSQYTLLRIHKTLSRHRSGCSV